MEFMELELGIIPIQFGYSFIPTAMPPLQPEQMLKWF